MCAILQAPAAALLLLDTGQLVLHMCTVHIQCSTVLPAIGRHQVASAQLCVHPDSHEALMQLCCMQMLLLLLLFEH